MTNSRTPQLDRLDRFIVRCNVHAVGTVSRVRIEYSIGEALRLATLPGEEEGRIYCFRRLSLPAIDANANRRIWMEHIQQALTAIASQAVHGTQPGAENAAAVFFQNREEALETLLRRALQKQAVQPDWYASSLLGDMDAENYGEQIPAIVERILGLAGGPWTGASILLSVLGDLHPDALLSAIPTGRFRAWIAECDTRTPSSSSGRVVILPPHLRLMLQRAAAYSGWRDPATVWLAVQAMLCLSPLGLTSGTAVKQARATLQQMEVEQKADRVGNATKWLQEGLSNSTVLAFRNQLSMKKAVEGDTIPFESNSIASPAKPGRNTSKPRICFASDIDTAASQGSLVDQLPKANRSTAQMLGKSTQAAGLFFLLNALSRLGIAAALDRCPNLAECRFADALLLRLAMQTVVPVGDPILDCLENASMKSIPDSVVSSGKLTDAWPTSLGAFRPGSVDREYLLRIWAIAVRRWCWRVAGITINTIVNRTGRVWKTRSDLDVTLPLAAVDLRIRRIGLDIDPGWLPWIGKHGLVVRFHYRDRESG